MFYKVVDCFVEPVDFIDEQQGVLAELVQAVAGLVHGRADILHAGKHGRQRDEFAVERIGHQPRQRRLAHAGWPPQDHRVGLACLEREAQRLAHAQ